MPPKDATGQQQTHALQQIDRSIASSVNSDERPEIVYPSLLRDRHVSPRQQLPLIGCDILRAIWRPILSHNMDLPKWRHSRRMPLESLTQRVTSTSDSYRELLMVSEAGPATSPEYPPRR